MTGIRNDSGSPHGYINGRDLSVPGGSASGDPTSSMSESDLMRGYHWTRTERCVCGGYIEAPPDHRAIAYAVELHNVSPGHQRWRVERECAA